MSFSQTSDFYKIYFVNDGEFSSNKTKKLTEKKNVHNNNNITMGELAGQGERRKSSLSIHWEAGEKANYEKPKKENCFAIGKFRQSPE